MILGPFIRHINLPSALFKIQRNNQYYVYSHTATLRMPSFWGSMRTFIFGNVQSGDAWNGQNHSNRLGFFTACFIGRPKPSVQDIQATEELALKIQAIDYSSQRLIIEINAGHCIPVELHTLKNQGLDSLIKFCKENAPPGSCRPTDGSGNRFPVRNFPVLWSEVRNFHWYWWELTNPPEASSFEPSQVDQPPPAQNHPSQDHETQIITEVKRKSFIDISRYYDYWV